MFYFISLLLLGICSGFLSGMLGIGGGVVLVPALSLIGGYDIKQSMAMSLAIIAPIAFSGAATHWSHGNIEMKTVAIIAIFAIIGSYLGANIANHLSPALLKKIFAILLIVIGLNILTNTTGRIVKRDASLLKEETTETAIKSNLN